MLIARLACPKWMVSVIEMSGRELSRAWLAVALASGEADHAPMLYRTVHVEQFETGLRLIATDSYWMAICWVPAVLDIDPDIRAVSGVDFDAEPGLDEVPLRRITVRDDEHLVRDLMKHVAKNTRKSDVADIAVYVDLAAAPAEEPAQPTLSPELAPVRCRFELPGSLRVLSTTMEGEYTNWRSIDQIAFSKSRKLKGATETTMSWWMLDRLAKVPRIVGAAGVKITWLSESQARWDLTDGRMASPPRGLFMAIGGPDKTSPPPPDEDPAFEQPEISAAVPEPDPDTDSPPTSAGDLDDLFYKARRLVIESRQASVRALYAALKIGPARAKRIMAQLEQAGIVSAPDTTGARTVLDLSGDGGTES